MAYRRKRFSRKTSRFARRKTSRFARKAFGRPRFNKYRRSRVKIPTRGIADYSLVKLKDAVVINTDVGEVPTVGDVSYINMIVSGSDLFNAFGTGNQPTGFDQWMGFYDKFIVHKSSIKVTPVYWNGVPTDGHPAPFQICITPITVNTLTSATIQFDEQPYAKTKIYNGSMAIVNNSNAPAPVNTGSQQIPSIYNSMMTKKMLGVKDLSDEDDVKGTDTESPDTQFYWMIEIKSLAALPPSPATPANFQLASLGLKIEMYYKCQFLDRASITNSDG